MLSGKIFSGENCDSLLMLSPYCSVEGVEDCTVGSEVEPPLPLCESGDVEPYRKMFEIKFGLDMATGAGVVGGLVVADS